MHLESVALACRLGLEVIAQGIETEEQEGQLLTLGCPNGQGYRDAKPLGLSWYPPLLLAGAA